MRFGLYPASAAAALIALGLGCAIAPPVAPPAPRLATFNEAEYRSYADSGSASLSGQGFVVLRGGGVINAAGRTVVLNPVTSYSYEWWDRAVCHGLALVDADPRVFKYTRFTTADGEGRFRFENLPPGEYYVYTGVSWERPSYRTTTTSAVNLGCVATLAPGQRLEGVVLSTLAAKDSDYSPWYSYQVNPRCR